MIPLLATMTRHVLPTHPEDTPPAAALPGQGGACNNDMTGGLVACATVLGMVFVLLEEQAASERRVHQRAHTATAHGGERGSTTGRRDG